MLRRTLSPKRVPSSSLRSAFFLFAPGRDKPKLLERTLAFNSPSPDSLLLVTASVDKPFREDIKKADQPYVKRIEFRLSLRMTSIGFRL